jgi:DNA-binding LytR/AlgR family response regulator
MQPFFFIKLKKEYIRINFADIWFIEARRNYIKIVTPEKYYLCLTTMLQIEQLLPKKEFCRIHRSYIIRIDSIKSFEREKIYASGKTLPVGDLYWKDLLSRFQLLNCGSDLVDMREESFAMAG